MIPVTKISETILEFGYGFLQEIPEDCSKSEFEAAISLIVGVWNASIVGGGEGKNNSYVQKYIEAMKPTQDMSEEEVVMQDEIIVVIKKLAEIKEEYYCHDLRVVHEYSVRQERGEFILSCLAKLFTGTDLS